MISLLRSFDIIVLAVPTDTHYSSSEFSQIFVGCNLRVIGYIALLVTFWCLSWKNCWKSIKKSLRSARKPLFLGKKGSVVQDKKLRVEPRKEEFAADDGPPHFLILGAQKAGTMAAVKNLNKHPEIFCLKEPHFST